MEMYFVIVDIVIWRVVIELGKSNYVSNGL